MTATQPYTVPILAGDLRRAEFVKQFADILDYMDSISQDMFNRIAIRLNIYRAQLNKFDERIQHAHAHIERIKGSKRAIQIHSSARYPVEQTRSTYKSIFEFDPNNEDLKPPLLHYNLFRLNETTDKFIDPNDKGSKSNDETIIVLKQYDKNFIQKTKRNVLNGLGKPPANIKSVVSFLKYNTQENPYTQPTKIDPLSVGGRIRKQVDEPAQPRIVETPLPAFYNKMSERPTVGDIGYNPLLGHVPQFSLPDDLPELDNYATFDDSAAIDWTKQDMPSIAPSFAISALPDIHDLSSTPTPKPSAEPPKTTAPPPPPPVDIPAIIPLTSASTTAPPPAPPPPPQAPPAPPLPSALPSVLPPPSTNDESQTSAVNSAIGGGSSSSGGNAPVRGGNADDDDDGGNPLLAAIRNFGRTNKLKPAKKADPFDEAPIPTSQGQESVMDALKRNLQRRRDLITGGNTSSSGGGSSADKTVAAPTPPPLPSTGGTFTDAIAAKAKEVADEKQRQKDDSDASDDNDDDWE